MSRDSNIHEPEESIKELDASVKEMQEQVEVYEAKGMDAEAKKSAAQTDGYYQEWLRCTTELANPIKNMKDDR